MIPVELDLGLGVGGKGKRIVAPGVGYELLDNFCEFSECPGIDIDAALKGFAEVHELLGIVFLLEDVLP